MWHAHNCDQLTTLYSKFFYSFYSLVLLAPDASQVDGFVFLWSLKSAYQESCPPKKPFFRHFFGEHACFDWFWPNEDPPCRSSEFWGRLLADFLDYPRLHPMHYSTFISKIFLLFLLFFRGGAAGAMHSLLIVCQGFSISLVLLLFLY